MYVWPFYAWCEISMLARTSVFHSTWFMAKLTSHTTVTEFLLSFPNVQNFTWQIMWPVPPPFFKFLAKSYCCSLHVTFQIYFLLTILITKIFFWPLLISLSLCHSQTLWSGYYFFLACVLGLPRQSLIAYMNTSIISYISTFVSFLFLSSSPCYNHVIFPFLYFYLLLYHSCLSDPISVKMAFPFFFINFLFFKPDLAKHKIKEPSFSLYTSSSVPVMCWLVVIASP